jgi:hypothetical protein
MISIIFIAIVIAGAGWLAWRRWTSWRTPSEPLPPAANSPQTLAFKAFLHGNRCLMAGQWADATAAFEQARTLDPKRPYVAERLAEVARQQHAASALAPVAAGG